MISIADLEQQLGYSLDSSHNWEADDPFKLPLEYQGLDDFDESEQQQSDHQYPASIISTFSKNYMVQPDNFNYDSIYIEVCLMEKNAKHQRFILPANQKLVDLADAFYCPCDHIVVNQEADTGRFFFFENVFYNDTAVEQDLSESIISQLNMPFLKASMQETKFVDLFIHLNYPYLYAHAGGCEHIVRIEKIRKKTNDDAQGIKCVDTRHVLPICDMCELNTPVKFTWNDLYAPKCPCFWCLACFEEFHFDKDGKAVYDFDSESIRIEY